MTSEHLPSQSEYTTAAKEFDREYAKKHPDYAPEEVETVRENSGLGALVRGEDLPLGSLGLISASARERRARIVGERHGKTKE